MDFVRFGFCLAQGVFYCLAQSTQRTQRRVVDCCAPMNVNHTSYFIFRITMRCMVETQYDAAGCLSTASLRYTLYFILHTLYFITMRCMVETQYDAAGCISTASLRYTSLPTSKKTSP